MKFVKFFVGLLLFIAPITFHVFDDGSWSANTPLGTLAHSEVFVDTNFAVHSFQWYTEEGRIEYGILAFLDLKTSAMTASIFMFEFTLIDSSFRLRGIFTLITLWGVALYLLLAIIDNEMLNLISDIFLIGLAAINLYSFLNYHNALFSPTVGIPFFTILAGVLGITGLVFSAMKLNKKR